MKLPSLSVILPNYNHAQHLPTCLKALLNQSVPPAEIIVIDDGSTDNSVEVIRQIADKNPSIKFYQNDRNRGVNFTINRGIELASGEYLYFPGADDEILPQFIEKSMMLLDQHPQAAVSCTVGDWRETGTGLRWHMGAGMANCPSYLSPQQIVELDRKGRYFIPNHTAIMKRSAFIEVGKLRPELKSASDWFAHNAMALRYGLCVEPEPLAVFNIYPNSYYHRSRRDAQSHREMLEAILNRLSLPEFKDVSNLMRQGGTLFIFGWPMLKLVLGKREHRHFATPTFLRKAFWHGTKLFLKKFTPAPVGNLYLKLAGYRSKETQTAAAH